MSMGLRFRHVTGLPYRVRLHGIPCDVEALESGHMLTATCIWVDELVDSYLPELRELGYLPWTVDRVDELNMWIDGNLTELLRAVAGAIASPDRASAASLALSYALFKSLLLSGDDEPETWEEYSSAPTAERLSEVAKTYNPDLADHFGHGGDFAPAWKWIESERGRVIVKTAKWAYRDQLRRWGQRSKRNELFEWGARIAREQVQPRGLMLG
jgi:hypothetical protein